MKQILLTKGQVLVEEVPAPVVDKGSLLVKVKYSLISTGTETLGIKSSGESIFQKVLNQPEKLKQALNSIKTQGITATIDKVKTKLESSSPIGYSCSGVTIDIGKNIYDIKAGEHVACSGVGYANHAEVVCVPRNLVSKVPEGLDLKH
jgi:NADPH:quinone reductase-like Zn-dependent oxidoreductase